MSTPSVTRACQTASSACWCSTEIGTGPTPGISQVSPGSTSPRRRAWASTRTTKEGLPVATSVEPVMDASAMATRPSAT